MLSQVILLQDKEFLEAKSHAIDNEFEWLSNISSFNPIFQEFLPWKDEMLRSSHDCVEVEVKRSDELAKITFAILSCLGKFSKKAIRSRLALKKVVDTEAETPTMDSAEDSTIEGVPTTAEDAVVIIKVTNPSDTSIEPIEPAKQTNPPKSIDEDFYNYNEQLRDKNKPTGASTVMRDHSLGDIVNGTRNRSR